MYCINYSGGRNRTHGQIEQAERIDSFEAGKAPLDDRGSLCAHWKGKMILLACWRTLALNREIVELSYPGSQWSTTLDLTRTPSGFGGSCAF